MRISAKQLTNESGFTLIETLVALALMGLVLSALANLTAQWLPNWNRGLDRIQRSEQIGIALQRIADDLAAAQSVPVSRGDKPPPLFAGSEQSVTFVRTALGPNAGPGLDVVHLGETTDQGGLATVRSRTSFRPLPPEASLSDQLHFGEPVVLLRAPYRLSFAYAAEDRAWKSSWQDSDRLPAKIRLTVRDASSERVLAISTVTSIHVQSSAQGDCKQPDGQCDDNGVAQTNPPGNAQQASPAGSQQAGSTGAAQGSSP
ncbi:MAG: type II secretion system protein [Bradyrhizobium sp.]